MVQVANPMSSAPFSSPISFAEPTSPLVEELSQKVEEEGIDLPQLIAKGDALLTDALPKEINLGQLVASTYIKVEAASEKKAHLKIDELEAHQKKLKLVTDFLSAIEKQLADNPQAKTITIPDEKLVEKMREILGDKMPSGNAWSRDQAEAVKTSFTRRSQILMQQAHTLSNDVNREIERGTELLQIARKLLELIDRLLQNCTSNQRSR